MVAAVPEFDHLSACVAPLPAFFLGRGHELGEGFVLRALAVMSCLLAKTASEPLTRRAWGPAVGRNGGRIDER